MTTTPNFDDINCSATSDMCRVIWELGLWEFVREFNDIHGFIYSRDPRVDQIGRHPLVDTHGHSGASFAFCLRNVQYIAKNGVNAFNEML